MPDAGLVLDYNRYRYARGNPVKYTDPSGHFSEEEIERGFGSDWRDQLSDVIKGLLRQAQYGDVLKYEDSSLMFVSKDGTLFGWDVSGGNPHSFALASIIDALSNTTQVGLYRSNAQFEGSIGLFDAFLQGTSGGVSYQNAAYNRSNIFSNVGDSADTITLSLSWYIGTGEAVKTGYEWKGFSPGIEDSIGLAYIASQIARESVKHGFKEGVARVFGGPANIAVLAIDVAQMFEVGSYYHVVDSHSVPLPVPAPETRYPPR